MPDVFAAIGTRLWLVIPGTVLTSRTSFKDNEVHDHVKGVAHGA